MEKKEYQARKDEVRQQAMDWQNAQYDMSASWGEIAEATCYFKRLAKRYGLVREFAENGII